MGSRLQSLIDSTVRRNFYFGEYMETQAAFFPSLVKLTGRDNHFPQDGKVLFGWRAEEEHFRHSQGHKGGTLKVCSELSTGQVSRT